jgi:WD40 repeat protein/ABC-type oligopeptide transport system ATPase subunit
MALLDLAKSRPYPGLRPFLREESVLLFGRDEQVDQLVEKLRDRRFLAVVGTSGCGKSSLVGAGLIPALESGLLVRAGSRWRVASMQPKNQPMRNLAESVLKSGVLEASRGPMPDLPSLLATLGRGPLGLIEALRDSPLADGTNVLLLVDQFEEIFRYRKEGDRREADCFVALLLETFRKAGKKGIPPVYVVLTMRSDYLGDCALFNELPEALNDSQFLTPKLTRDQRREAIEGPAGVFGGEVEEPLVRRLLNDMGPELDQLPLMQHVLMQLWCRAKASMNGTPPPSDSTTSPDFVLRLDDYDDERIGGLGQALDRHAELIYGDLSKEQQAIAKVLFCCLSERDVSGPGEAMRDIRRPTKLIDVARVAGKLKEKDEPAPELMDLVRSVVDKFRDPGVCFLMPASHFTLEPETYLDVSHESILRQWGSLQKWLGEEARAAEFYRRLLDTAQLRSADLAVLWGRTNLAGAKVWEDSDRSAAWASRYGGQFESAMGFLRDSEKAAEEADKQARAAEEAKRAAEKADEEAKRAAEKADEEAKRAAEKAAEEAKLAAEEAQRVTRELQVKRRQLTAVALMALGTIGLALWANDQRRRADREKVNAVVAEKEAKKAEELLSRKTVLLTANTVELLKETGRANEKTALSRSLLLAAQAGFAMDKSPQLGLLLAVEAADPPRDPKHPSLRAPNSEVALRTGLGMVGGRGYGGHQSAITAAAISPDDRWIVTVGFDGNILMRDVSSEATADALIKLPKTAGSIRTPMFAPPADPREPDRDSRWMVTLGTDSLARLWDLTALHAKGEAPAPILLKGHGPSSYLEVSPDGRRLLTTYTTPVYEGGLLAKGPVASLWYLEKPDDAPDRFINLGLPENDTMKAICWSFSPDNRWLIVARGDGKTIGRADLWDLERSEPNYPTAIPLPLPDGIPKATRFKNVIFTRDSKRVILTLTDATALIWNVGRSPDAATLLPLRGANPVPAAMETAVTDLEGRWVVTRRSTVAGRGAEDPTPAPPVGSAEATQGPAPQATPSNPRVRALPDVTTRLYDLWDDDPVATSVPLARFPTNPGPHVSVSPDRNWLVSTIPTTVPMDGGTTLVWDLRFVRAYGPRDPSILRSQEKDTLSNAISPDGLWIATTGADNLVRLWSPTAPYNPPVILRGHDAKISVFQFTPDGDRLLTASADKTARLWDLRPLRPVADPESSRLIWGWPRSPASEGVAQPGSSAGRWLGVQNDEGGVGLWDLHAHDPEAKSIALPVARSDSSSLQTFTDTSYGRWLLTVDYPKAPEKDARYRNMTLWDSWSDTPAKRPIAVRGMDWGAGLSYSSPDGRWLAVNATSAPRLDAAQRIIFLLAYALQPPGFDGGARAAKLAAYALQGPRFIGGLRFLDLKADEPGVVAVTIPTGHYLVGFTAGGWGFVTSGNNAVHLWTLPARSHDATKGPIVLREHDEAVHKLLATGDAKNHVAIYRLDPGGERLVIGRQSGDYLVWRFGPRGPVGDPVNLAYGPNSSNFYAAVFGGGGRWLVSIYPNGNAQSQFWDLDSTSGPIKPDTPFPSGKPPESSSDFRRVSPDGRHFVTSSEDGSFRLWNLMARTLKGPPAILTGEPRKEGGLETISTASFSNDGRWLVTLGDDSATLWDLKTTGHPSRVAKVRGHGGSAALVMVTEDRSHMAIANANGTIRVWDLKSRDSDGRPSILSGARPPVTGMIVTSDGSRVLASGANSEVHVWSMSPDTLRDKARRVVGRNLTRWEWDLYFPDEGSYRKTFHDLPAPDAPAARPVPR